jgi:hypothetical protein
MEEIPYCNLTYLLIHIVYQCILSYNNSNTRCKWFYKWPQYADMVHFHTDWCRLNKQTIIYSLRNVKIWNIAIHNNID